MKKKPAVAIILVGRNRMAPVTFVYTRLEKGIMNMSENNGLPATSESPVCSTGCKTGRSGILRAVMYAPIVMIASAMAAVAMFPNLSEYATPLIGEPSLQENSCPIARFAAMIGMSSPDRQCCSSQMNSAGSCPLSKPCGSSCSSADVDLSVPSFSSPCCPSMSRGSFSSDTINQQDSASTDEIPADAFAAANVVVLETSAN